jgi:hypothetical protein
MKHLILILSALLSPLALAGEPQKFAIPDGAAYICKNKKAGDMLLQLMYSRTSAELASVIAHAPTQRIDKVLTWLFVPGQGGDKEFNYRNTNVSSTILKIQPQKSSVLIVGDGAALEFGNCLMIKK